MSIPSVIIVRIKKGDIGKTMQFDPNITNEIDWKQDELSLYNGKDNTRPYGLDSEYIVIACNYDGYIDGVGAELVTNFSDYDKALNLALGGDCSRIYNGKVKRYAKRGEDWEDIKPQAIVIENGFSEIDFCCLHLFNRMCIFLYDYEVGRWKVCEQGEKKFKLYDTEVNY